MSRVDPGGLAAAAGVCEGEVLLTVGGKECSDHAQAIKLLDAAMPLIVKGQAIELLVENDGRALGEDSLGILGVATSRARLRLPLAATAVAARAGGHGQLAPHFLGCYRHGTG